MEEQKLDHTQYDAWLETLPDDEIPGFEETAAEIGLEWATEHNDLIAETCFEDFSGNNPIEWSEDAVDLISTSCKRLDEAEKIVQEVVTKTLERLGVKLNV
jgi:hypothetical protein